MLISGLVNQHLLSLPVHTFPSAAAMADPLTLLRQYYTAGKSEEIVEAEGQIVFGDLAWPKDVRTNFKAYG